MSFSVAAVSGGVAAPAGAAQNQNAQAAESSGSPAPSTTGTDKKLTGFGVIDRVIASGDQPVFQADGYRIRIVSTTATAFSGELKTLADVGTNTWVKYEGSRDGSGVLVATKASFIPVGMHNRKDDAHDGQPKAATAPADEYAAPAQDSRIDAKGNFVSLRTKVRMNNAGGWCGWHRIPAEGALQQRVRHVGMSVVPAYQKQMADGDPSKIHFRFYAVDEPKIRSEIICVVGLVLVPRQVVERLRSDDQLAAVLADGVAYNIQVQSARLNDQVRGILGVEIAGGIAGAFIPGVNVATGAGSIVAIHEIALHLEEQRGRMALTMLADAGYDPRQAPEAWRLLEPKKLPGDPASLKYPKRSEYQLGILNLQYSAEKAAGR